MPELCCCSNTCFTSVWSVVCELEMCFKSSGAALCRCVTLQFDVGGWVVGEDRTRLNLSPLSSLLLCVTHNKTLALFQDAFHTDLRVSHLVQLMGYHPEYLEIFLRAHNLLMHGDGPLAFHVRVYIAILVSGVN